MRFVRISPLSDVNLAGPHFFDPDSITIWFLFYCISRPKLKLDGQCVNMR